eukprot:m.81946 g.81946  ORF g.81946 m.81946 type:complete len:96 (+) comp12842_c0_seq1:192-479(+)
MAGRLADQLFVAFFTLCAATLIFFYPFLFKDGEFVYEGLDDMISQIQNDFNWAYNFKKAAGGVIVGAGLLVGIVTGLYFPRVSRTGLRDYNAKKD